MARISEGAKLVASFLLFAALLYLTTMRTIRVYHVPVPKETIQFGLCDFHNAVYFPGLAYSRGENPYSSAYAAKYPVNREMSPYAPLLLPFCAVFGILPLTVAEIIWYSANVILIFVFAYALLHLAGARVSGSRILFLASFILLSRVGQSNQILGQFGLYFSLLTLIAIHYARSSIWISAIGVAFALIKPTFGIPLVLLMAAGGKIRPAIIGVLIAAVGSGLSLSWMLLHEPTNLMSSFARSQGALEADADVDPDSAWMRTDLLSVVARNLSISTDIKSELVAMVIILIPAFLAMWKLSRDEDTEETRSLEQSVVFLAIPMSIYHLSYDLLLLFPAIALAMAGKCLSAQSSQWWFRLLYLALLVIPVMNYVSSHSVMERLQIQGFMRELAIGLSPISLLAANVVLWLAVFQFRRMESKPIGASRLEA